MDIPPKPLTPEEIELTFAVTESLLAPTYHALWERVVLNGKDANLTDPEARVLRFFGDESWERAQAANRFGGIRYAPMKIHLPKWLALNLAETVEGQGADHVTPE